MELCNRLRSACPVFQWEFFTPFGFDAFEAAQSPSQEIFSDLAFILSFINSEEKTILSGIVEWDLY